jgi:hypothetical protein
MLSSGGAAAAALVAVLAGLLVGGGNVACAEVAPRISCPGSDAAAGGGPPTTAAGGKRCTTSRIVRSARVTPSNRGLRFGFAARRRVPVTISVFQSSTRRRVVGERLVFRATRRSAPVRWSGRRQRGRPRVRDGVFFVRLAVRHRGRRDTRRFAVRRMRGRFRSQPAFARRDACGAIRAFKLERPAFGGRNNRAVSVSFRLARDGRAVVDLRRGGRTVRRLSDAVRRGGFLHRVRLDSERLRRGRYEVRLRHGDTTSSLFVERI